MKENNRSKMPDLIKTALMRIDSIYALVFFYGNCKIFKIIIEM